MRCFTCAKLPDVMACTIPLACVGGDIGAVQWLLMRLAKAKDRMRLVFGDCILRAVCIFMMLLRFLSIINYKFFFKLIIHFFLYWVKKHESQRLVLAAQVLPPCSLSCRALAKHLSVGCLCSLLMCFLAAKPLPAYTPRLLPCHKKPCKPGGWS